MKTGAYGSSLSVKEETGYRLLKILNARINRKKGYKETSLMILLLFSLFWYIVYSYAGIEGIEMKENKKQGESVEDMVIDTEELLRNARGQ